jgi:uncharacterized GH25 family protein
MKPHSAKLPLVLLALALAVPALAHDTWLLARSSSVQPGTSVILDLTSGMAFPANETAIKPDRVARAGVRLAGSTSGLEDRRSAATSLQFTARLSKPGVAVAWVELAPKSIDLKPGQVKEYLDEIGASEAVLRTWAEMPEPRRWRELYSKHTKAYLRVGQPAEGDRSWAEPVGMSLEIVPEKDPTSVRPGEDLPVRVLLQGKPLPSFSVGLVRQGNAHGMLKTTDGQGRVTFPIAKTGRWLLRATDVRRSTRPEADWESDFTTLTFEVR